LRYFAVRFVDEEELDRVQDFSKNDDIVKSGPDGTVLFILPKTENGRKTLQDRLAEQPLCTKDEGRIPIVVALPSSTAYLDDLARELAALERVQSGTPALQSDAIARKEMTARLNELQQLLEQEVARVFSADNPDCTWYASTGRLSVRSSRE